MTMRFRLHSFQRCESYSIPAKGVCEIWNTFGVSNEIGVRRSPSSQYKIMIKLSLPLTELTTSEFSQMQQRLVCFLWSHAQNTLEWTSMDDVRSWHKSTRYFWHDLLFFRIRFQKTICKIVINHFFILCSQYSDMLSAKLKVLIKEKSINLKWQNKFNCMRKTSFFQ